MKSIYLLKELTTDMVYRFSQNELEQYELQDNELGMAFRIEKENIALLKDLKNQNLYKIPCQVLESHRVPDKKLGYLLRKLRITGISRQFRENDHES